jgi:hypothetical protein
VSKSGPHFIRQQKSSHCAAASAAGPGRVKIAWKARTVGRDGAFCAAELSIPRDRPPGRHKVTQRLPGMVD